MKFKSIVTAKENEISIITLNRPEARNAISSLVMDELTGALDQVEKDNTKVVILTGGGKSFCAGADLKEVGKLYGEAKHNFTKRAQAIMRRIERFSKPVIAAVNGYAFGGGLELALACDIRIIVEGTKIGLTETKIGLNPAWGGSQRLPRLIFMPKAREMILTGDHYESEIATEMGIFSRCVPATHLMEEAMNIAKSVARGSSTALKYAKAILNADNPTSLEIQGVKELYKQNKEVIDRANYNIFL